MEHVITSYSIHYTKLYDLGAALMSASLLIMVGLTGYSSWMKAILGADTWYVIAVMLAPIGVITSYSIHYTKLYEP